jgi:hypothetical protein
MKDECTKVISGDRIVKFTYVDLPGGNASLTAQIAGHEAEYHSIAKALSVTSTMSARQFSNWCHNDVGLAAARVVVETTLSSAGLILSPCDAILRGDEPRQRRTRQASWVPERTWTSRSRTVRRLGVQLDLASDSRSSNFKQRPILSARHLPAQAPRLHRLRRQTPAAS